MSELSVGQLKGLAVNNNTITVPSGHKIYEPGSVVQVLTATSGFTRQTITSGSPVALSGLSITITPKFATSKILIQGVISASWTYVAGLHVFKNGVDLVPNHGGTLQTGGATALFISYFPYSADTTASRVNPWAATYWDSPGTTSAVTYDFRANSGWNGGSSSFYFNDRAEGDMLSSSYMTVMEIAQ